MVADAAGFELGRRFALVAVPMQTLQLLPGAPERAGFFASAARALVPGGLVAAAIADALEEFDGSALLPAPDTAEADGRRFISQPVAVRPAGASVEIERVREIVAPGGARTSEDDVVVLAERRRRRARRGGRALRAARRAAADDRGHGRSRRLDGGDAAWLSARCGSARCTRT